MPEVTQSWVREETARPRNAQGHFISVSEVPEPEGPGPNLEYVRMLIASSGGNEIAIGHKLMHEWSRIESKNDINKAYFAYQATQEHVPTGITPADALLFKSMLLPQVNDERSRLASDIETRRRNIADRFASISTDLGRISELRERMQLVAGRQTIDLSEQVTKIVEDGWFTYRADFTNDFNQSRSPRDHAIIFTTSTVFMRHHNNEAGVNLSLDMGKFLVRYFPARSVIRIYVWENNIENEGYLHPHLSGDDLCWGNASTTYTECMTTAQPARAFQALRVILCTYNDDNPFVSIGGFIIARNPNAMDDMPITYVEDGQAWVNEDDIPGRIHPDTVLNSHDTDDGYDEAQSLIRLYRQARGGVRIPGEEYYMRARLGTGSNYFAIDSSIIQEWD